MADLNSQRQIQIHCDNFKFTTANSMRQIQINHGKFNAANPNSPRDIQIHCGNFTFTTAKTNSSPQNSDLPQQIRN